MTILNNEQHAQEFRKKIQEAKLAREARLAEEAKKNLNSEEPKDEPKEESKEEPKEEPRDEPKEEPKDEPKEESKEEPKDEPKEEPTWTGKVFTAQEIKDNFRYSPTCATGKWKNNELSKSCSQVRKDTFYEILDFCRNNIEVEQCNNDQIKHQVTLQCHDDAALSGCENFLEQQ